MKTIALISLILAVSPYALFAGEPFQFRGFAWGTHIDEVRKGEESKPLVDLPNMLGYVGDIAGFKAMISFAFEDEKLITGTYFAREEFSTNMEYIRLFERVAGLLKEKYGDTERQEDWLEELFKGNPTEFAYAVARGHVRVTYQWDLDNTTIIAYLYSEDDVPQMYFTYSDKSVDEKNKAEARQRQLNDL